MRLMPRSLFWRLLGTAAVALLVALIFAGFAIGNVLERFVMHGLDERLDAQIAIVARAVRSDGSLDPARATDLPPFDRLGSGWAWEVRAPGGTLRSASLGGREIVTAPLPPPPPELRDTSEPRPYDGHDDRPDDIDDGPHGPHHDRFDGTPGRFLHNVHGRMLTIPTARGDAQILATGPRAVVQRPLRAAMTPLLLSLLLLGAGLGLAILIQLRIGLRPLANMQAMVADVRAGRRTRIDATEPSELRPLVEELNGLIEANRTALEQARGHVANLAHGLKTPLAALKLDLAEGSSDRLAVHVDRIEAQIRHHLGRARAASPAGAGRVLTPLAPHVADLIDALGRIHADRAIRPIVTVGSELMVQCDPQDLDEMIGNLLDNAWRWARTEVRVTAGPEGRMIAIAIADDGPGISEELLASAIEPGRRLDERGEGHGFGLSIARELAELHGGRLMLANGTAGGLIATLHLPG
ncbi:sensor histidine kinase [Sphingomonas sp. MMS24-J13]|uniref:sensor histidine kinase n=1 Tax=Sphingomonas sp. MMS24-J13 TaxID=3238686 RepID=UPI0038515F8B